MDAVARRLERRYAAAINKLLKTVLPSSSNPVEAQYQLRLGALQVSQQMVQWANATNKRDWRKAAETAQGGKAVRKALQQELTGTTVGAAVRRYINASASHVASIPAYAAAHVANEVHAAQLRGARPAEIAKIIKQRYPQLMRNKVRMLARTQSQAASTALNEARSEELDLPWYVWLSSKDQRTRKSHKKMDNVLVPWAQPPDPEALIGVQSTLGHYHSGECPNCRCTQSVLLNIDDVSWPHRVYYNNRITRLTRAQFLALPINKPLRK